MNYLSKSECKHRGLYRIFARNLRIGVYDEATGEFYGIREKFGSRYVFGEYHWDNGPPYGTVKPVELIPEELPAEILAAERLPGLVCNGAPAAVAFTGRSKGCARPLKDEHNDKHLYEHLDGIPCEAGALVYGAYLGNDPLFKWLEEMEAKYPFDLQWDRTE